MNLLETISKRTAAIGVIGLGYVGLPLIIEFHEQGFAVTGFDIDDKKVNLLNEGKGYIKHIDVSPLFSDPPERRRFKATTDFSLLAKMDCILICVPTPLNKN